MRQIAAFIYTQRLNAVCLRSIDLARLCFSGWLFELFSDLICSMRLSLLKCPHFLSFLSPVSHILSVSLALRLLRFFIHLVCEWKMSVTPEKGCSGERLHKLTLPFLSVSPKQKNEKIPQSFDASFFLVCPFWIEQVPHSCSLQIFTETAILWSSVISFLACFLSFVILPLPQPLIK